MQSHVEENITLLPLEKMNLRLKCEQLYTAYKKLLLSFSNSLSTWFHIDDLKSSLTRLRGVIAADTESAMIEKLEQFLAWRGQRILETNLLYCHDLSELNALCLEIAMHLSPITNKHPYQLLMPIRETEDVACNDLQEYPLGHFILSEDNQYGLPVNILLNYIDKNGLINTNGKINPFNAGSNDLNNVTKNFISDLDLKRLIDSSQEAKDFYESYKRFSEFQDPKGALINLIEGLRGGGVSNGSGTHDKASQPAYDAIDIFRAYLKQLDPITKKALFRLETPRTGYNKANKWYKYNLGMIWNVLEGKDPDVITCVEVAARHLEDILNNADWNDLVSDYRVICESNYTAARENLERILKDKKNLTLLPIYSDDKSIKQLLLDETLTSEEIKNLRNMLDVWKLAIKKAREGENVKLLNRLLELGAFSIQNEGHTPLQLVADQKAWDVFKAILNYQDGALLKQIFPSELDYLLRQLTSDQQFATQHGQEALIIQLIQLGADPFLQIGNGKTILQFVIERHYQQATDTILSSINSERSDHLGQVWLDLSRGGQYRRLLKFLARVRDKEMMLLVDPATGNNALHYAAMYGYQDVIEEVLAHNPGIAEEENEHRQTILDVAIENKQWQTAISIFKMGKGYKLDYTLEQAGKNNDWSFLFLLLSEDTRWAIPASAFNQILLHLRKVKQNSLACSFLGYLLQSRPDVKADGLLKAVEGEAMHLAAQYNKVDMINRLLGLGVSPWAKNKAHQIPLQVAIMKNSWGAVSALIRKMENIDRLLDSFDISTIETTLLNLIESNYWEAAARLLSSNILKMKPSLLNRLSTEDKKAKCIEMLVHQQQFMLALQFIEQATNPGMVKYFNSASSIKLPTSSSHVKDKAGLFFFFKKISEAPNQEEVIGILNNLKASSLRSVFKNKSGVSKPVHQRNWQDLEPHLLKHAKNKILELKLNQPVKTASTSHEQDLLKLKEILKAKTSFSIRFFHKSWDIWKKIQNNKIAACQSLTQEKNKIARWGRKRFGEY